MNPLRLLLPALIVLLGALLSGHAAPAGAEALLLITGDQHSAYERTAQLVATVDRLKAENPGLPLAVLLDGDTMEYGNIVARRSAGAVDFAMFAALAARVPTLLNLGNHEPEFYALEDTVRRVEATGVKVVSNIVNRATNRPFAPASALLPLGRATAVVVGLTTDRLSTYRVAVRPSLDLANPVVWAKRNFPELLAAAPLRIVLSHAGVAADREMLGLVPVGTLFAGAHDHLRFVQPLGRTVYFHSGSWNEHLSLAWLCRDPAGAPRWVVEQIKIAADGPADPALAALIRETKARHLTPEDTAVIGSVATAMSTAEAAKFAAAALRGAAGVDAAFIGNTTFGAGLPAGGVTRAEFDACVRFDGPVFTAEVDGARLAQLLAAANQGPETPFEQRRGEFSFAAGPAAVDPAKTYRIATTDWGAKNTARYFGEPAIAWREQPALKLKAAVRGALGAAPR
ncbi:MAG: 5'-nucleotidase C-terminal domain-containing protein [Opitutae bacterium]|nr:5'-nucleotidase C-terminal domain-containing protein [Opitutae bacterium]